MARLAADLRRSHDRLSGRLRRSPVAVGHHAGPDHAGQDRRRRAAGRRVRRPGRHHESLPCRQRRQGDFRPAPSAAIRWQRRPAPQRWNSCKTQRSTNGWKSYPRGLPRDSTRRRPRPAFRMSSIAWAACSRRSSSPARSRTGRQPVAAIPQQRSLDFFWGLIRRGVYCRAANTGPLFVSASSTPEKADIDATILAACDVLSGLQPC